MKNLIVAAVVLVAAAVPAHAGPRFLPGYGYIPYAHIATNTGGYQFVPYYGYVYSPPVYAVAPYAYGYAPYPPVYGYPPAYSGYNYSYYWGY